MVKPQFTGSAAEYFRIWIVNLFLTLVSLGVYSAWAKVRKKRYFYGATRLDGDTFDYFASPKAILYGRIIAVVAFFSTRSRASSTRPRRTGASGSPRCSPRSWWCGRLASTRATPRGAA